MEAQRLFRAAQLLQRAADILKQEAVPSIHLTASHVLETRTIEKAATALRQYSQSLVAPMVRESLAAQFPSMIKGAQD